MDEADLATESSLFVLDSKNNCPQEAANKLAVKQLPCSKDKLCDVASSSRSSCSSRSISVQCLFSIPNCSALNVAEECWFSTF